MKPNQIFIFLSVLVLAGAGCSWGTPEQRALEQGLVLPSIDVDKVVIVPPSPDSLLGLILASRSAHEGAPLPALPPLTQYDIPDMARRSGYDGWETDRINASSFDSLTNSLNAIMAKMLPDDALSFDKVVKYVLMQVVRDPIVLKKAATGGRITDAEILRAIQSTLHQRSPRDVFETAERYLERATPGPQGGSAPPGASAAQIMGGN